MKNLEKILSTTLILVSIILIIDTILSRRFDIGNEQKGLQLSYCIAFVLSTTKFPTIMKNKFVVYPLYIMITQMLHSLVVNIF